MFKVPQKGLLYLFRLRWVLVAALGISVTPRGTFGYSAWTLELWCVGAAVAAANPEHTRAQWLWRVASVALGHTAW